ncbi:ABC transporter permease [Stakelama tenebrarum]|uniref:ABC transporter permease subunit n=1 Tax=Stakelama tenebrarum TaxID=2711215 RepID=A0A6G6Y6L5_9SPHN|nr:ABC transporter permease [Sphingosinithalassobacter tenebrarum]QIG80491.1 ABC transporter permease subunit [Sphingosinithalassobacter tenebrarum]
MLLRYLTTEILKLRRSLALLLCLAAPTCVVVLATLMALDKEEPVLLPMFGMSTAAFWAFAMLPLTLTALSVLLAQIEHGPRAWNMLLTMPGAWPNVYLAKALVMAALIAAMTLLLFIEAWTAAGFIAMIKPVGEAFAPGDLAQILSKMTVAAILVAMLQLWVALRFRSFVPPLVFGIAGTFVAIAATSAKQGIYFPWLLAVNMLSQGDRQAFALWLGGAGGLVVLLAMLVHLGRHEA